MINIVGNFEIVTPQYKQEFEEWCRGAEAKKLFQEASEEVQSEYDAFLERNSISHKELHTPFGIQM